MGDLAASKRLRAGAAGWLTRASKACETLSSRGDLKDISLVDFEGVLTNFVKRLDVWDEAEQGVEVQAEDADLDDIIETAADFREKSEKSRNLLIIAWGLAHPVVQPDREGSGSVAGSARSGAAHQTVRLPKLELPKFHGDVLKFMSFWQQFKACVDDQDSLPDVQKYNYLVGLLKGDAKAALEGLSITQENYATAKDIVQKRFGRKELIIFAHIQALLTLPVATTSLELVHFNDRLVANVRALDALGIRSDNFGVILTPIVVSRLSSDVREEWSRESEDKEADLGHLMKFLEKEIRRKERCKTLAGAEEEREKKAPAFVQQRKHQGSAAALANTVSSKIVRVCDFCGKKGHSSAFCFKYLELNASDRQEKVGRCRLCFKCLSKAHQAKQCNLVCKNCGGSHHFTLCFKAESERRQEGSRGEAESSSRSSSVVNVCTVNVVHVSFLPTARVRVRGQDGWVTSTLLFDSGSDRSYISQALVAQIRPKWLRNTAVTFSTFGGRSHGSKAQVFGLSLKGEEFEKQVSVELTQVPVICLPLSRPSIDSKLLSEFSHLDLAFDFASSENLNIDILIGQDLFWSLMSGNVFREEKSGIVAQESVFGWVLSGKSTVGKANQADAGVSMLNLCTIPDDVVKTFWDLESIGVKDNNIEVDSVFQGFKESIEFNEESGRYRVGLTWKEKHPPLLDNKRIALSSLVRLEKRLESDPSLKDGYDVALSEMETLGFIEEVSDGGEITDHPVFYLPHHPCVKESSVSTKIRPVFNASCKGFNGVSLNDCLEAGPNLNPGVVDIVLRFRRWRYAVSADIRKAFLQIEMQEKDQDVQRFLWRKDGRVRTMKFVRVTFGVNCSPFLLSGTICHHLSLCPPSFVVKELQENLYVDDFLSGADDQSEVQVLFQEANKVMQKAGMTLAKWTSNESAVLGEGPSSSGLTAQYIKVLGISWDPGRDHFTFVAACLPDSIRCTKRVVLSMIARVFDPLGFVLPVTMSARFLFQDVWRLGLDWDDELPESLVLSFMKWLGGLSALEGVVIPRQYFEIPWSECLSRVELHAFGDASMKGFGACIYLRVEFPSGESKSSLVRSCARVAPLEKKSLPRLELLGCLVTAQLLQSVIKSLRLSDNVTYFCWSDSMVALGWIQGLPSKWKPWVANRVSAIQSLSNPERWKHIAGLQNPADLVTRGVSADKLIESDLWWHGPAMLSEAKLGSSSIVVPVGVAEIEAERKVCTESLLVCLSVCPFEMERWSTLNRACRVIAFVLRFISSSKGAVTSGSVELSADEYVVAKKAFIKILQLQHFQKEIMVLQSGKAISRDSKLFKLSPFVDEEGFLRVRGRLQLSELAYESKHPLILPKCHGAMLLVRFVHSLQSHAGVESMITFLRCDYEIFGLRLMAKAVKKECAFCQRMDVRACNEPPAPLPKLRVTKAPVFSVTGIDFAGPVFCVDFPGKKFYICLFVCGVVRAVHLELVESLTSEDFILAFRRFCALKRVPSVVYTDNGTNFVGAKRLLSSYLGPVVPEWKFICPRSPWWGGWWERLVRSVKSAIKKTIGKTCLSKTEFETCLCEVASSINSRPLTFVGTDIQNRVPLTPNHFLAGQGNQGLESRVLEDPEGVSVEGLSLRHQEFLCRQDDFWRVWSGEYLRNLPAAFQKFRKEGNLSVGSVVLIREDGLPRMKWLLGVVKSLHIGKDGVPRAADLRTAQGTKTRAIQRLYNLEISGSEVEGEVVRAVPSVEGGPDHISGSVEGAGEDLDVFEGQSESVSEVEDFSENSGRRRRKPKKFEDYVTY